MFCLSGPAPMDRLRPKRDVMLLRLLLVGMRYT